MSLSTFTKNQNKTEEEAEAIRTLEFIAIYKQQDLNFDISELLKHAKNQTKQAIFTVENLLKPNHNQHSII